MRGIARWRLALAAVVLVLLIFLLADFAPYYFHNMELQTFVSSLTRRAAAATVPDQELRGQVVQKARELKLPVDEDNVHVNHMPDGLHIDVRYLVPINLPGYSVNLHFYPGAGSH